MVSFHCQKLFSRTAIWFLNGPTETRHVCYLFWIVPSDPAQMGSRAGAKGLGGDQQTQEREGDAFDGHFVDRLQLARLRP